MADHPTRNPDIPRGMPDVPFWLKPEYADRFTADGSPRDPRDAAGFDPQAGAADCADDDTDDCGEDDVDGGAEDLGGDGTEYNDPARQALEQDHAARQREARRARRLQAVADFTPVRTATRADGWSPEVQREFLEALAETGSVRTACGRVCRSPSSAYRLRRRTDARGFAQAWEDAINQAAVVLSDQLWDRAMIGQEDVTYHPDGTSTVRRRHDNRLAMWLLKYHDPVRYGALVSEAAGGPFRRASAARFPALLNGLVRAPARALARMRSQADAGAGTGAGTRAHAGADTDAGAPTRPRVLRV